jgi:hypothetical protein
MNRGIFVLGLLSLLALDAARANATTSMCNGEADGTPCSDTCIAEGTCMTNVCMPIMPRPDGTLCSSGNACTANDHCASGMCVAGGPVTCPSKSACMVGACNSSTGCYLVNTCPPDLAMQPEDLSTSPRDLAGADLSKLADMSLEPNDMCVRDPGVEFYTCTSPEGGTYTIPFDAGSIHVRGSAVGDCALSTMPIPPPWTFVLVLAAALLLARKRAGRAR